MRCTTLERSVTAVAVLLLGSCAATPTPVAVDHESGFALYRSGRLSGAELAELCRAGVEEMVVLDGGVYDSLTRTIRWEVGDLAACLDPPPPGEPGPCPDPPPDGSNQTRLTSNGSS